MNKTQLIHAIVAASATLGIEAMTDGDIKQLSAHLDSLNQRITEKNADAGNGDTGTGDTGTGDAGTGDTGTGDTGISQLDTGGGTTQPDPKLLGGDSTVEPQTGGGTTQPDPKVMVQSSVTIETRRPDGTKLRLVADKATEITADDYALIKVLDYVKTV